MRWAFFFFVMLIVDPVTASNLKCTTRDAVYLEEDGTFHAHPSRERNLRKVFFVDTLTGEMTGELTNVIGTLGKPVLLDKDVPEYGPLKVLTFLNPGDNPGSIYYLQINWLHKKEKPFMYLTSDFGIVTGTCVDTQLP